MERDFHDKTGKILSQSGYDVKIISPEEAAVRLNNISRIMILRFLNIL
jgi:hypothetical protein